VKAKRSSRARSRQPKYVKETENGNPTPPIPCLLAAVALDDGRDGLDHALHRRYHVLVSIHRPLGIAILILVVVRFVNRLLNPPPPLPATMSRAERLAATASEYTMYGLMFVLPLVGWGMLSAARYPIVLYGSLHLPFILPHDAMLYSVLRKAHTVLAYLFFLTFIAHFGAILFHTLIVRDGILKRMAPWNIRPQEAASRSSTGRP
jgi:cytochrome b561